MKVFNELLERDLISWTKLIVAYAIIGDIKSVGKLFGQRNESEKEEEKVKKIN